MAVAPRAPGLNLDDEELSSGFNPPEDAPAPSALNPGGQSAAAPPALEEQTEIISASGDLRLSSFFAGRFWALSMIPLLFTAVLSNITSARVGERIFAIHGGTLYEDIFFQSASIPFFVRHLLPFGLPASLNMPAGMDSAYGQSLQQWYLQTSPLLGLAGLLIGFLFVIAITRNSNDGVYACGPYAVYSTLAVLLAWRSGLYYEGLGSLAPAILAGLVVPVLAATGAKVLAISLRNAGLFEIDLEQYAELQSETLSTGAAAALASNGAAHSQAGAPAEAGGAAPEVSILRQPIARAIACPFCGNSKLNPDYPGVCSSCHRNLALTFELLDSPPCPSCSGYLVRDAAFCHHCGVWLKAPQAEDEPPDEDSSTA